MSNEKFSDHGENSQRNVTDLLGSPVASRNHSTSMQPWAWAACTFTAVPRSAQPCFSPGLAKSITSFGRGKGGSAISAGWQVTLCDPIWHVSVTESETEKKIINNNKKERNQNNDPYSSEKRSRCTLVTFWHAGCMNTFLSGCLVVQA